MKIGNVIKFINARASDLDPALIERNIDSFVIDSREIKAGDLFFALSQPEYKNNGFNGEFDDATRFVRQAFESGAASAVVREDRFAEHRDDLAEFQNRLLFVDDSIKALQNLARSVYQQWAKPVVAVTGSAGKTTAKELTAHVLSASCFKVLRNIKNYNNGLGHPLTILNVVRDPNYDAAVLEMGMSTPMNEIRRLCSITPPDVAVVLNVLPVHVEHLGSIENVAKAKAELIEGMKPNGTAVLNADDPRVLAMASMARGNVITFGIDSAADVTASEIIFKRFGETEFMLTTPSGSAPVRFALNGRHNLSNALSAAAVGHIFGMTANDIAAALGSAAAPQQRGEVLHFAQGFTVINDSYNSNPDALLSMVHTLIDGSPEARRRIVVAGEMLELGDEAAAIHHRAGSDIAALDVHLLIGVRGMAQEMIAAAGSEKGRFAPDSDAAGEMLVPILSAGDVVLIKGSRGVRTEKVLDKILAKFELEKGASGTAGN
ncbi:MAG: UDP-N-acetylmuramoyl-tripeptide--D-alanyl-D-alanine ligase [Acidobacteriota bacterium]